MAQLPVWVGWVELKRRTGSIVGGMKETCDLSSLDLYEWTPQGYVQPAWW